MLSEVAVMSQNPFADNPYQSPDTPVKAALVEEKREANPDSDFPWFWAITWLVGGGTAATILIASDTLDRQSISICMIAAIASLLGFVACLGWGMKAARKRR